VQLWWQQFLLIFLGVHSETKNKILLGPIPHRAASYEVLLPGQSPLATIALCSQPSLRHEHSGKTEGILHTLDGPTSVQMSSKKSQPSFSAVDSRFHALASKCLFPVVKAVL